MTPEQLIQQLLPAAQGKTVERFEALAVALETAHWLRREVLQRLEAEFARTEAALEEIGTSRDPLFQAATEGLNAYFDALETLYQYDEQRVPELLESSLDIAYESDQCLARVEEAAVEAWTSDPILA